MSRHLRKSYFLKICDSAKSPTHNATKSCLRDVRSVLYVQTRKSGNKPLQKDEGRQSEPAFPIPLPLGIPVQPMWPSKSAHIPAAAPRTAKTPTSATLQRLARKSDISDIKACNLRNLPENYTPAFFERHVAMWPELSLVSKQKLHHSVPEFKPSGPSAVAASVVVLSASADSQLKFSSPDSDEGMFAGYALGRLEQLVQPVNPAHNSQPSTRTSVGGDRDMGSNGAKRASSSYATHTAAYPPPACVGHVTSVAVHEEFRGLGVAKDLMHTLHDQFRRHHHVDSVQLHVRVSNAAAIALYSEYFGYKIVQQIPDYYADKEAAYLMQLDGLMGR